MYRGLPGQAVAKNVAVVSLPAQAAASARGRQLPTAEGPPAWQKPHLDHIPKP